MDNAHVKHAFLAGALSASLFWSLGSWALRSRKVRLNNKNADTGGDQELTSEDNSVKARPLHDQLQQQDKGTSTSVQDSYNPWKNSDSGNNNSGNEQIHYKDLLELRTSLIEHSKRTSLVLLDKILGKSQIFIGELPSKKRIRWPWESLRKNSITDEDKIEKSGENGYAGTESASILNENKNLDNDGSSDYMMGDPSLDMSSSDDSKSSEVTKEICIGSIFGLDVGGTLSKLVYFEKKRDDTAADKRMKPDSLYQSAEFMDNIGNSSSFEDSARRNHSRMMHSRSVTTTRFIFHESCSEDDLRSSHYPLHSPKIGAPDLAEKKLKRSHSLFELSSKKAKREEALDRFYEFANTLDTYDTQVRDENLSFYSRAIGGEFHFIQFETRYLPKAMDLIRINDLHLNISKMGATGGGAHKYSDEWERMLGIEIAKQDELDSLVAGMQFIMSDVVGECYTFKPNGDTSKDKSKTWSNGETQNDEGNKTDESGIGNDEDKAASQESSKAGGNLDSDKPQVSKENKKNKNLDQYWWCRKVKRDFVAKSDSYPYLLVMIGTGVSVLRVDGPRKHERISGSTIGGGTYWGLCKLLTDVEDFESVLNLAERGDPSKVDMMVGDIYGKDSNALDKLGLTADIVASSFGKLVAKDDPAAGLKQEDLARALLLMVTNNIGQVAYLNAQLHGTKNIYFVGNFLRHNAISQQRLSYAINYWSRGKMEALFLEHEGYFGALGAFLLHQGISSDEHGKVAQSKKDSDRSSRRDGYRKKRSVSF